MFGTKPWQGEEGGVERFHPILLHSLLVATRRFEPALYDHICREQHLDAERIMGLFSEVDSLGSGQLAEILAQLRLQSAYSDIVFLAGRNAFALWAQHSRLGGKFRLGRMDVGQTLRRNLPPFLGRSSFNHLQRGEVHFAELRDSVFARGASHHLGVCGFYAGFLMELGQFCGPAQWEAAETRCRASDPDASACLIQFAPLP